MAIVPVNTGSAVTPITTHAGSLDVPIPATGAGNDLVIGVDTGDDPNPPGTVVSISVPYESLLLETGDHLLLETGSKLLLESSSAVPSAAVFSGKVAFATAVADAELWNARAIEAGITRLRITFSAPTVGGAESQEYSGVQALGITQTATGAGADPSISLVTQDNNNVVAATFSKESTATGPFTGALVGTERARIYALGNGLPDVAGIYIDNASGIPAAVTCQGQTNAPFDGAHAWAGVALELRTVAPTGTYSPAIWMRRRRRQFLGML